MSAAAIQLLCRRWDLPRAAIATLDRFFTSLSAGHTNTFLTLIDDGCTCPSKNGACNFSAAGHVCRSAVLAPRGATGQAAEPELESR